VCGGAAVNVRKLRITNFRGIGEASFTFKAGSSVFVGPNACSKSALIDALALVLGRNRMVRPLTEHDFLGGSPSADGRIRIIATVTGFGNDPEARPEWFRSGRAVPKWVDADGRVFASPAAQGAGARELCAQVGFAARFVYEDLEVETVRFFCDGDDTSDQDPFSEEQVLELAPPRLVSELGLYVLPARRTWEGAASFASDLFRRLVEDDAGVPAEEILSQRDQVRNPTAPIEASERLTELVGGINARLARWLVSKPTFQLRLTSGDTEGVLNALLPHYKTGAVSLPASRNGSGLVSLQVMLLLLELGRARRKKGLPFVLALEEPELHLAPGLQLRLITEAIAVADQVICTTHSPEVAASFDPPSTFVMRAGAHTVTATPLFPGPLKASATNLERKLYHQNRGRFVGAVMHPYVLVPEGRFDGEWLERLVSVAGAFQSATPFKSVFGVAPTEDAAVRAVADSVRRLRSGVVALIDGDPPGDAYKVALQVAPVPTDAIVQWASGWSIEDAIGWIMEQDGPAVLGRINDQLDDWDDFASVGAFVSCLKILTKKGVRGLKGDVVAHDVIVGSLSEPCLRRGALVLDALVCCAVGQPHDLLKVENESPRVLRLGA
jgi:putative ATP-dependent endonuclease of OLD family